MSFNRFQQSSTLNVLLPVIVSFALVVTGFSYAQEEESNQSEEEDTSEYEEIRVTGTRLPTLDPSARIEVITEEMIRNRGFSSLEDIVRNIPHNLSTINSQNNLEFGSSTVDSNLGALGLGNSTVNLRGFGSANTLVLLNGRRLAGIAGDENFLSNTRFIPVNSIAAVEVLMDGGSVIYGSDAVAGVVNIITKKNYTGGSVDIKSELSSNADPQNTFSANYGHSWDSGSFSISVSQEDRGSTSSYDAGYTTRNYSSQFGGNSEYDFRFEGDSHAGVVGFSRWGGGTQMTLGRGNDGRNATEDQFRPVTPDDYLDAPPREAAGSAEDRTIFFNIDQQFGSLGLYGEYKTSQLDTAAKVTTFGESAIMVPASNAFNPFGRTVFVQYNTSTEIDLGVIPPPTQTNEDTSDRFVLGFDYSINDDWEFTLETTESKSKNNSMQFMFATRADRDFGDPAAAARIQELIASSDPNQALNLLGDGTGQNDTINEAIIPIAVSRDGTTIRSYESYVAGSFGNAPGGAFGLVLGTEQREEGVSTQGSFYPSGIPSPKRDLSALFAEFSIPIIGEANQTSWAQSLSISIQARDDNYDTRGANGSDDNDEPILLDVSFSNLSPRVGFNWEYDSNFRVRGSYAEAFRAPTFNDLFGTFTLDLTTSIFDPLCECFVPGRLVVGPQPDLRPEYSDNWDIGFSWTSEALGNTFFELEYSIIDFQDRIAHSSELRNLLPAEVYGNLPEFFERAPDGTLLVNYSRRINVSRRLNKTVDLFVRKDFSTDMGQFTPSLTWSYVVDMYDEVSGVKARFLDEINGIDRYQLAVQVDYVRNKFSGNLHWRYTPGYLNNSFDSPFGRDIPNVQVDSYSTLDINAQYQHNENLAIRGGARNAFYDEFPFVLNSSAKPYDARRVDLRGRILYAEVSYRFGGN